MTVKSLCRAASALILGLAAGVSQADEINLYSARHYDTDQQLYDAFTAETGIRVNLLEGDSDQLIQRIKREGIASPADVLITVDAGRLWRGEAEGIFTPVNSDVLKQRLPESVRHPEGLWFGFSQRIRAIFYNKESADPSLVQRYEDLARPELKDKVCIRSSNNIYNQSLLASLITHHGKESAEQWANGVVSNMARDPVGGDTDQLRAAAAGECDYAVANHYYYLRLLQSSDAKDRDQAARLGIIFPNQDDRGAHVNVGGAGVIKTAPNPENAVRFMEFLASDTAQRLFAEANELPVVDGIEVNEHITRWGDFVKDDINVSVLGTNNPEAVRIFDRAGWR